MIRVGITGGVGMGKSTVGKILSSKGFPTIDTDDVARQVVDKGSDALKKIVETFGDMVLDSDGFLNRKKLGDRVFGNPDELKALNSITHPEIRARWKTWLDQKKSAGAAAAFVTIPLLFEIGADKEFDKIVCVACSLKKQRGRLDKRGWNPSHADERIRSQMGIQQKIKRSDFLIWTDTSIEVVEWQIEDMQGRLSSLIESK